MTDQKYSKYFSKQSLWDKLKEQAKNAGLKVVYAVLVLFYTMESPDVKTKTKLSIAAALGYFILPTDAIFDLTPIIGYSDDLGVLLFVLTQIGKNVTPEIKEKAKAKLDDWFGNIETEAIREIDEKIS
ncbi:YkvA family protein [Maribellus sediminis]|uniref:YkvA family protein n=1 Tax=Maribellus sediminis TaxID=2696285 RepID=UPI0014314482|nr:DUF1232 domain-containing protein [Maribellus sediminis]